MLLICTISYFVLFLLSIYIFTLCFCFVWYSCCVCLPVCFFFFFFFLVLFLQSDSQECRRVTCYCMLGTSQWQAALKQSDASTNGLGNNHTRTRSSLLVSHALIIVLICTVALIFFLFLFISFVCLSPIIFIWFDCYVMFCYISIDLFVCFSPIIDLAWFHVLGNHDCTFDVDYYRDKWYKYHDVPFSPNQVRNLLTNCTYLEDSEVVLYNNLRIWGMFCLDWLIEMKWKIRERTVELF
jgi:hypothetical protein